MNYSNGLLNWWKNLVIDVVSRFKWENDNFWWERLKLSEIGFPKSWDIITVPDKLFHFLICFFLTLILAKWVNRHYAALISWFIMMVLWEIIWDGMFRYGASWKDMVANTLGCLVCWWWLASYDIIGQL